MAIFSNTTWGPLKTAGRYILTSVGSAIAALGAVGLMSQSDAATAAQAVKDIAESLGTLATSIITLISIAAPIYAGARGTLNDTPTNIVTTVNKLAEDKTNPVKGVVIADTPEGREMKKEVPGPAVVIEGTRAAAQITKT